jgi:hypothetical protein
MPEMKYSWFSYVKASKTETKRMIFSHSLLLILLPKLLLPNHMILQLGLKLHEKSKILKSWGTNILFAQPTFNDLFVQLHSIWVHCLCVDNKFPGSQFCQSQTFEWHQNSKHIGLLGVQIHQIYNLLFLQRIRLMLKQFAKSEKSSVYLKLATIKKILYQKQTFAPCFFTNLIHFHRAHFLHGINFAFNPAIMVSWPRGIRRFEQGQLDGVLDHFNRCSAFDNSLYPKICAQYEDDATGAIAESTAEPTWCMHSNRGNAFRYIPSAFSLSRSSVTQGPGRCNTGNSLRAARIPFLDRNVIFTLCDTTSRLFPWTQLTEGKRIFFELKFGIIYIVNPINNWLVRSFNFKVIRHFCFYKRDHGSLPICLLHFSHFPGFRGPKGP